MELTLANPVYRPAKDVDTRYRCIYGGAGSGKSVFVAQDELARIAMNPHERTLVLRKVKTTIRNSTYLLFNDLINDCNWGELFNCRDTDMSIKHIAGGQIIHAGLDDAQKLKSIAQPTRIWIEEATECSVEDLSQSDLRLRGVERPQLTITFNPSFEANRIFQWLQFPTAQLPNRNHTIADDLYVQHTTYLDNPWIDPDEYMKVFRKLGGQMQAIYEHGLLAVVDEPDQLIKYPWVKAAREMHPERVNDGRQRMGVDVARFGDDQSVIAHMQGMALKEFRAYPHEDLTNFSRICHTFITEQGIAPEFVGVDGVGLGAGVVDNLWHDGMNVTEIIGGAVPIEYIEDDGNRQYRNLRAQMWWHLRESLEQGKVSIAVEDDEHFRMLQEELLAPRYRYASERMIEVEPKVGASGIENTGKGWGIRQRIGRSPDFADAFVMAAFVDQMANDYMEVIQEPVEDGVFVYE